MGSTNNNLDTVRHRIEGGEEIGALLFFSTPGFGTIALHESES